MLAADTATVTTRSAPRPRRSQHGDRPADREAIAPAAGWAALADGRWDAAAGVFTAALRRVETPESLEGLSWAAWWRDDAETVFEARQRAFRLYRLRGDAASAARMATWLAADYLDFRGAFAVANGWFRRAGRLLEPLEPRPDHGWLAFHEGYVALMRGDTAATSELAARASASGRRFAVADLEMLGLALQGAVLVTCGRVAEGMRCLDEATAAALGDHAAIPISRAWTCCFMVGACEQIRDYRRAFEWCDRIAEFVERYGSDYMLGFCRQHYATVHVWRGRWEDAETALEAALAAYTKSRPSYVDGALTALAELRRRQGRGDDAERLLDAAGASAFLCRGWLALDRGDAERARHLGERALRQIPGHCLMARTPALELIVAAATLGGDPRRADHPCAELREIARLVGTGPLRAAAALADGMRIAGAGDHEGARRLLEDAVDGFDQSGAPFDTARARLELARSLIALDRRTDAAKEAQSCLQSLTRLGAEGEARRARSVIALAGSRGTRPSTLVPEVTRRESEVLRCLAEGLTNRRIADRLGVSEHTIHRHVTSILRKLDLPTRAAAAAHAVRAGLLDSSAT
jgi:DNA-binding NarL/FixJ family response regulator